MPREKSSPHRKSLPETQQLVKEMCPRDNYRTQNEFIEKAIRFYAGYVSGQDTTAYLPPALASVLRDAGPLFSRVHAGRLYQRDERDAEGRRKENRRLHGGGHVKPKRRRAETCSPALLCPLWSFPAISRCGSQCGSKDFLTPQTRLKGYENPSKSSDSGGFVQ